MKNELSYILHKQIVGGQAYGLALLQGRADAINRMPLWGVQDGSGFQYVLLYNRMNG
jgi:hypothetical protein